MDTYHRLLPEQRHNMKVNFDPRSLNELEILKIMRLMSPDSPSNKCLISVTESYNYPFKLWASRIYEKESNVANKMITPVIIVKKYEINIISIIICNDNYV